MIFSDNEDNRIAIFDVALMTFFIMLIALAILFPFLSEQSKKTNDNIIDTKSTMMVELFWPDGQIDVDLWILGPADKFPVGYSSQNGSQFDLLRDDLGLPTDVSNINYELATSKANLPGEYIINVKLYNIALRDRDKLPFKVNVVITMLNKENDHDSSSKQIFSKETTFTFVKEEQNIVIFSLDEEGHFLKDSIYTNPRKSIATTPEAYDQ